MDEHYVLRSLTPENLRCAVGPCPEVFDGAETGAYLIIGKVVDPKKFGLENKVGSDEVLISIPKRFIDEMQK